MKALLLSLLSAAPLVATPEGFTSLFNGKNLNGWWGAKTENPINYLTLSSTELEKKKTASLQSIQKHWHAKDGILHNDGKGLFLTTEKNYADFEFRVEYKLAPKADSGIYLRGIPQVQIWDTTKETSISLKHGAAKGSGGLWNNPKGSAGREPLVHADRPIGEWNKMTIRLIGETVTVILNGKIVVDEAKLINFFEKKGALPDKGPIQLQTHGAAMQWRKIYLKEL